MKTISIINLKGGVAKTLTADSMAHVLATFHNKRVLLVDNDKRFCRAGYWPGCGDPDGCREAFKPITGRGRIGVHR